tara:strand:+ start:272 stop:517 length:246 start_codon:yes stop_codon:yes gene_type:complete
MTLQQFNTYAADNKKTIVNTINEYGDTLYGIEVSKGCYYYFGEQNNGNWSFRYAESRNKRYSHFKATSAAMKIACKAEGIY